MALRKGHQRSRESPWGGATEQLQPASATSTKIRIIMGDIEKLAESVASLQASFEAHRYICSDEIATAVFFGLPTAQAHFD
jgi:hypothetical protein